MGERTETKSETARQVILKTGEKLYYVSMVSVRLCDGQKVHRATFHAQTVEDSQQCDLDFEIPQDLYNTLIEYTRQGNPDLILVLLHEDHRFKWSLMSQSWLRQYSNTDNINQYVV
jgi:hypothetical protein